MIRTIRRLIATDGGDNKEWVELAMLSSDDKPVSGIINGSIATEVDTGSVFFFDEAAGEWIEQFSFQNAGGGGGGGGEEALPAGYTRLEYVDAYLCSVNTGIVPDSSTIIEAKVMGINMKSETLINEAKSGNTYYALSLTFSNTQSSNAARATIGAGNSAVVNNLPSFYQRPIYVKMDSSGVTANGATASYASTPSYVPTEPLYLFCGGANLTRRTGDTGFNDLFFWMKITKNDEVVRHYVPARRDADNVSGLYDLASKEFFESASPDSSFYPGPAVPGN